MILNYKNLSKSQLQTVKKPVINYEAISPKQTGRLSLSLYLYSNIKWTA